MASFSIQTRHVDESEHDTCLLTVISNAGATACPGRLAAVEAARPAPSTSVDEGDTDSAPVNTGCRAGGIATRWN
jgi:hypothetical protein